MFCLAENNLGRTGQKGYGGRKGEGEGRGEEGRGGERTREKWRLIYFIFRKDKEDGEEEPLNDMMSE
jgi:hypothetical protein